MPKDLISVIIPTFNRDYLIGETLNSIIAQSYTNWECIIVDDGSTDQTAELIESFIEKDNRFQYHLRPDDRIKGANACRNYGFEISRGDYIKWFDSDDIMHPDFLKKQLEILLYESELDFCAAFSETFADQIKNVIAFNNPPIYVDDENSLYNYISGKLIFLTPSPLWKRAFLKDKRLFDESLSNAHETDFNFARLIEGAKFQYSKEVLFYVRRGHNSIDLKAQTNRSDQLSMFKYYQKVFLYLTSNKSSFGRKRQRILTKFILLKLLMVLYRLRKISSIIYFLKELNTTLLNVFKAKLEFKTTVKILVGIFLLVFFKKGYRFFDLEELKEAKY